jgi:Ner family transcriptional regulator
MTRLSQHLQTSHERIKHQLRLQGCSLADVARELGVRGTTVTAASKGRRRSRRIEAALAAKLGFAPEELWPERYRLQQPCLITIPWPRRRILMP